MVVLIHAKGQPCHHLLRRIRLPVHQKGVHIRIILHNIIAVGESRRLQPLPGAGRKTKLRDRDTAYLSRPVQIFLLGQQIRQHVQIHNGQMRGINRLVILLRPVVHARKRFRVRVDRNAPVIIPVRQRRLVKAFHNIPAVKKGGIVPFVAVPGVVNAEIHPPLRIMALHRLIKDAERFFKLLGVMVHIPGVHIIPHPVLVDLVGYHPAVYQTVFSIRIPLRQKSCHSLQGPGSLLIGRVKHIIVCAALLISRIRVDQLRECLVPVI